MTREFSCQKCGGEKAIHQTFATWAEQGRYELTRRAPRSELTWLKISCSKCAFTDIFNEAVVNRGKTPFLDQAESNPIWNCERCKNSQAREFSILAKDGSKADPSLASYEGSYKVLLCNRCGYAELYEIHAPFSSLGGLHVVPELAQMACSFHCKKCFKQGGLTWFVDVDEALHGRISIELLFVRCKHCKFVEVYDRCIWENTFRAAS